MIYIKRVVFCLLISEIRFLSHSEEDFLFFRYVKGGSYQVSDAGKSKFFLTLCSVLTSQYSLPIYFFPFLSLLIHFSLSIFFI